MRESDVSERIEAVRDSWRHQSEVLDWVGRFLETPIAELQTLGRMLENTQAELHVMSALYFGCQHLVGMFDWLL